jgi:tRNA pseudouridine55 synthase
MLLMLSGILNLDKPRGMTSHDVVAAVRRILGIRAVGHTGTLDPDASGVLMLCLGAATKYASFFATLEKTYWTVLQLGLCTDTQDATGTVTRQREVPPLTPAQLRSTLERFQGSLQQIPPMYSAVKYRGQRLYRLARQGQTVARPARDIFVQRLELLEQRGTQITLRVTCSKGTYIRTLAEDIGLALGCGAHVVHLQRCRVGPFSLQDACSLDVLQQHADAGTLPQVLMPVTEALSFLPALTLTMQQYDALRTRQGQALSTILNTMQTLPQDTCYRLCVPSQQTVAIIQRQCSPERWKLYVPPVSYNVAKEKELCP